MLPVAFVSHGAPTMALSDSAPKTVTFLRSLGTLLGLTSATPGSTIKAAIVISAHWENSPMPAVSASAQPHQVYDFYGFPQELYKVKYDMRGSPEHASRIQQLLSDQGVGVELDDERGIDHGAWVPMMHMMPQPTLPIIQLSLIRSLDYQAHVKVGQALRQLRREGYLIIGSGGAVHNLGRVDFAQEQEDLSGKNSQSWAVSFQNDLIAQLDKPGAETVSTPVHERLLNWIDANKERVKMAHPRVEHFMPLVVVAAACEPEEYLKVMHRAFQFGTLGLGAWISAR